MARTVDMRLELTRRADYAMRAMVVLARQPDDWLRGPSVAIEGHIPAPFVTQVMGDLVRAGLADARIGRRGGYRIARHPAEVSLLAIVEAVEGDTRRRRCVLRAGPCPDGVACELHEVFTAAQEAFISRLAAASVADAVRA